MTQIDEILTFWFGDPETDDTSYQAQRKRWFRKSSDFDAVVTARFKSVYEAAAADQLDHWQTTPQGSLALVLVLDQFPRNMFRQSPKAFATDAKALAVAQNAIAQGFDRDLNPLQRLFLYLPFEHREDLAMQQQSVRLMQALVNLDPDLEDSFDYAIRHREVIERFGRFPHRNAILGRTNTPEEVEFLKQPGSSF